MAIGTCRCRPEAERHSAAAATGAVATGAVTIGAVTIGAAVTNSSLPVDLVFRITATVLTPTVTTTSPLTDTVTTAINGRRKKRKYVSEADAINKGDRPAPMSHYPPRHILVPH